FLHANLNITNKMFDQRMARHRQHINSRYNAKISDRNHSSVKIYHECCLKAKRTQVEKKHEICKRHKFTSPLSIALIVLTLATWAARHVQASGAFELEFMRLDDVTPRIKSQPFTYAIVCLKEAFASQLSFPCAYGNASITLSHPLHVQQQQQQNRINHKNSIDIDNNIQQQANAATTASDSAALQSSESTNIELANVARIPFTFRWMKSFTLIVTLVDSQSAEVGNSLIGHQHSNSQQQFSNIRIHSQNDTHVSTENEVVPAQGASRLAIWSYRSSRSFKTNLGYRFRVYCSANYYGDDCATFCRARNDHFGHYNCSVSGQKVCLDGWHGIDCDIAKCRSDCNDQHGYCDKPGTCTCRPGWTGARCDQCLTYPGCAN
ncbi:Protein serrate, partial [Fragariocoptes setiger]